MDLGELDAHIVPPAFERSFVHPGIVQECLIKCTLIGRKFLFVFNSIVDRENRTARVQGQIEFQHGIVSAEASWSYNKHQDTAARGSHFDCLIEFAAKWDAFIVKEGLHTVTFTSVVQMGNEALDAIVTLRRVSEKDATLELLLHARRIHSLVRAKCCELLMVVS